MLPAEIAQEESWIAAARRDPQAFAPLYERYHKPIFLFVLKRVQDRDLCGDLTAQVFLKSMAALPKYEGRGLPFKAWLYRIALNEVLMHFRRNKGKQFMDVAEPQAAALITYAAERDEDDDRSIDKELMERLARALGKLLPAQTMLIELRFFDGLSFLEVGQVLGIAEAAAKMRTHRVLGTLREYLAPGAGSRKSMGTE
ncbi:MAG: sigma-70 family RNA polymerase sigma factor [Flavobacteriales bacterium]|nr:sigma-70 family RNA polymerase sigma factor [Flavobacteriales bacterium]